MAKLKGFNIRVYGLCLRYNKLLVTDEFRMGMKMTKFPGGGMIPGESTIDCLKRELFEETGEEIIVGEHLYTTDYFQTAIFKSDYHLLSIYYNFDFSNEPRFACTEKSFDFELVEGNQSFRWIDTYNITAEIFTLPVDKKLVGDLLDSGYFNY